MTGKMSFADRLQVDGHLGFVGLAVVTVAFIYCNVARLFLDAVSGRRSPFACRQAARVISKATAWATLMPSTAADSMPPAYPAPSPAG